MTKKKASRKSNDTADDNRQSHNQKPLETDKKVTVLSRQFSMEEQDSSQEKVQNLKSLNAMLVKQTVEKRAQIDSLVQTKDELETELARYGTEKTGLRDELDQVSDENIGLKIELALVIDFFENRFKEMGVGVDRLMRDKSDRESEIKVLKEEANELMGKLGIEKEQMMKVCGERELIKSQFDLQRDEVFRLKECVILLEKKESNLEVMIGRLTSENDRLVKESRMSEVLIEGVKREKTDLEKTIEDNKKEIDGLQSEIKVILCLKNELETVTTDQKGEIKEMEKKLDKLNETVQSLTKEERILRDLVNSVEKNLDESMEKERAMMVKIDALGKEKTINEAELARLMEEKNSVEKQMKMANVQSSDMQNSIDQLSWEKIELQEGVYSREAKLVELNQKVDDLMHAVAVLKKDCNDQTKTNDKLRGALAEVELKREEADKALDEKKRHEEDLKAEVLKSEKIIEITLEKLEKIKTERQGLYTSRNILERQSETLKGEKAILEKELVELKKAMDALKSELESTGLDAKRSLVMLKSAASMLSQSEYREDRFVSEQQKEQIGTKSYMVELESIEKAFKNKEDIIEEMKKEAETMKQSTEEAHKKQSFWTLVSSVTTIVAAASFAYAARTR